MLRVAFVLHFKIIYSYYSTSLLEFPFPYRYLSCKYLLNPLPAFKYFCKKIHLNKHIDNLSMKIPFKSAMHKQLY